MLSNLTFEIDGVKVSVPYYDYVHEEEGITPEIMIDHVYRKNKFQSCYMDSLARLKEAQAPWSEERLRYLAFSLTLYDLLTLPGYKRVHQSLGSVNPNLSEHEFQVFDIMVSHLKDQPEYMMSYFHEYGIFPALLYKEGSSGIDCLNKLNQALKSDPKLAVESAIACFAESSKFPENLNQKLDHWLAQQLSSINFKRQVLDQDFVLDINSYMKYSSVSENEVCSLVCKKIDAFKESSQKFIWQQIMFKNSSEKRISEAIKGYLSCEHNEKTNKIFYSFVHNLPRKIKAKILGEVSESAQRNYLHIVKQQKANVSKVKIEDSAHPKEGFLMWHLHDKDKLSSKEIVQAIQDEKVEHRREPARQSFLFKDKTKFDKDIFKAGCYKFKNSVIHSLMWMSSFSKLSNFASNLAFLWPELPPQIRQNENIQLSCDNHFDLFYHLAEEGNTSMLNEIKQTMKDEYPEFIRRLMRPHEDGDTCLHLLCRQGKKGVLNLLKELPKEQQKELLNQPNDMGQTPLDVCSADFRRFLDQKNFIRPVSQIQKAIADIKSVTTVTPEKPVERPSKKLIWRPQFKSKRYIDDREKFKNQPNVIKGARREIAKLRSMSWPDLQLRMGQDIKRSFKSRLCAADFSANGNAYRVGYILQDGVIGLLFIMTHQQYNKELKLTGSLDTVAQNVRKQIGAQVAAQRNGGRQ